MSFEAWRAMATAQVGAGVGPACAIAAAHLQAHGRGAAASSCFCTHLLRRKTVLSRPGLSQSRLLCAPSSSRITALFGFRKDAEKAGIYASQGRDEFDRDDVEQYFNYMGMLATEGSYDKLDAMLNQGIHPVDILLIWAAQEGDKPKIQELLRAGAKYDVPGSDGRTALDRAQNDEIRELILSASLSSN